MVVTLGQQCPVGEEPTVTRYTYINHHAGTPDKKQKQNRNTVVVQHPTYIVVIIYYFIPVKNESLNGIYTGSPMIVTLGQQYNNVGEKPTVILYTYINRHAEPTSITKQKTM